MFLVETAAVAREWTIVSNLMIKFRPCISPASQILWEKLRKGVIELRTDYATSDVQDAISIIKQCLSILPKFSATLTVQQYKNLVSRVERWDIQILRAYNSDNMPVTVQLANSLPGKCESVLNQALRICERIGVHQP